ncbi:class I SAM-dependent methyltransferase [Candidatus Pacearchaeota archaeon]|nr:class I SAM-dependent methyltransferase [Candidatus Pacearchaeota archaeon]
MENSKQNNLNQEQIWDAIAGPWSKFRRQSPKEVQDFLIKQKGKVLDLGCGSGRNLVKLEGIRFYGVDFAKKQLEFAEQEAKKQEIPAEFIKARCSELPFEDNFFDAAIFISVLHCMDKAEERKKSLEELYRVLKKGASVMISVWDKNSRELFKEKKVKEGLMDWKDNNTVYRRYYYFYDEKELKDLLESIGFKIEKTSLIDSTANTSKHSKKNLVFYCQK